MTEISSSVRAAFDAMPDKKGMELHDLGYERYFYISLAGVNYLFQDSWTSLNDVYVGSITGSKARTHHRISSKPEFQAAVRVPKTLAYKTPSISVLHEHDTDIQVMRSIEEIIDDIERQYGYPVFLKPDISSMGRNTFFVEDRAQLSDAVSCIIEGRNTDKDVVIAQECIDIAREYRAVYFKGEIITVFDRMFAERGIQHGRAHAEADLSCPVSTRFVEDPEKLDAIHKATHIMAEETGQIYFGSDFAEDTEGNLWFVESQTGPMLHLAYSGQGQARMDHLASRILEHIAEQSP